MDIQFGLQLSGDRFFEAYFNVLRQNSFFLYFWTEVSNVLYLDWFFYINEISQLCGDLLLRTVAFAEVRRRLQSDYFLQLGILFFCALNFLKDFIVKVNCVAFVLLWSRGYGLSWFFFLLGLFYHIFDLCRHNYSSLFLFNWISQHLPHTNHLLPPSRQYDLHFFSASVLCIFSFQEVLWHLYDDISFLDLLQLILLPRRVDATWRVIWRKQQVFMIKFRPQNQVIWLHIPIIS